LIPDAKEILAPVVSPNGRQTISSGLTWFWKVGLPALLFSSFLCALIVFAVGLTNGDSPVIAAGGMFAGAFLTFGVLHTVVVARIKCVDIDESQLHISDWASKIRVPLEEIKYVREQNLGPIGHFVDIEFFEASKVGKVIRFIPESEESLPDALLEHVVPLQLDTLLRQKEHSIVTTLRLVAQAKRDTKQLK
jgi:hypothetical protein